MNQLKIYTNQIWTKYESDIWQNMTRTSLLDTDDDSDVGANNDSDTENDGSNAGVDDASANENPGN